MVPATKWRVADKMLAWRERGGPHFLRWLTRARRNDCSRQGLRSRVERVPASAGELLPRHLGQAEG